MAMRKRTGEWRLLLALLASIVLGGLILEVTGRRAVDHWPPASVRVQRAP